MLLLGARNSDLSRYDYLCLRNRYGSRKIRNSSFVKLDTIRAHAVDQSPNCFNLISSEHAAQQPSPKSLTATGNSRKPVSGKTVLATLTLATLNYTAAGH
jgi:hypothetical protein